MSKKGTFIIDNNLDVSSWSPEMEEISYRMSDSVVGKNIHAVFPQLKDSVAAVLNEGKRVPVSKVQNGCCWGMGFSADIVCKPVKNKAGDVTSVSVEFSKFKGGCPLAQKLSDYEKMIEIGKVASSLAHGVRNPLNAIKGAVVYLEDKFGHESTLLEFSTIITEEINKLDNFISNFLGAARGEMKFFPVNVNDLIGSILRVIKLRAEVQKVTISTNLSALPLVPANLFQLEQSIFNIINNSFEALPDGGLIEIVTGTKWENDMDYVVIEITDNGKGIPAGKLTSLGKLSGKAKGDDRGFGVFLSREIIKSHGGRLQWESLKDQGTTFRIYLPAGNNEQ